MYRVSSKPPGGEWPEMRPGDVLLVVGQGWKSDVVRLFDRSPYSHTAISYDDGLLIVEALAEGVVPSGPADFDDVAVDIVHLGVGRHDAEQIQEFLDSCVAQKWGYGWIQFVNVGLANLTGGKLAVKRAGTSICSGLCAEALVRAGLIFSRPPAMVTPRTLAKDLGVLDEEKGEA